GLHSPESGAVLDCLNGNEELTCPGTQHIAEQLALGLERFLETDAGEILLRSKPNGVILAERFNLSRKTDTRKKSFARLIRDRLNRILDPKQANPPRVFRRPIASGKGRALFAAG